MRQDRKPEAQRIARAGLRPDRLPPRVRRRPDVGSALPGEAPSTILAFRGASAVGLEGFTETIWPNFTHLDEPATTGRATWIE